MAISSAINAPGGDRPWRWMRRGVNLAKRPVTVKMSASLFRVVLTVLIGALWTGFALNIVRDVGFKTDLNIAFSITLPGIGVLIILVGLFKLVRRRKVTFDDSGVTVTDRGIRGGGSWTLPYRSFEGIYMREETIRSEKGATTYQIIEPLHADPEKSVPLYVKATHDAPTGKWQEYARTLHLPAITETNGRMVVLRPDEISPASDQAEPAAPVQPAPPAPAPQPMAPPQPAAPEPQPMAPPQPAAPAQAMPHPQRAAASVQSEGRASRRRNSGDGTPKGITVSRDTLAGDPVLNVVIRTPRYPYWLSALFLGLPLAMIGVGLFGTDLSSLAMFGVAFLLLAGLIVVPDWRSTREIDITRSYLTFTDNMGRGGGNSETIPVRDIRNISIRRARTRIGNELVVSSDYEEFPFGVGLSKDALTWLQTYLTASIANV